MASSQDYLTEFQNKLDALNAVKDRVNASLAFRQQFSKDIKKQLTEVNARVQYLVGMIQKLKTTTGSIESAVNNNSGIIAQKNTQIQDLTNQLESTRQEKNRLESQFNAYKADKERQIQENQAAINQHEAQLRTLTQSKEEAERKASTLTAERTQIDEQYRQKEQELTAKINECEGKLTTCEQQLRDKTAEHAQAAQAVDAVQERTQTNVQNLQQQITGLTEQNNMLVQRLISATEAIHSATENLQMLTSEAPNAQTKEEVDQLIRQITSQIEQSIENIGRATQGQQGQGQTTSSATSYNVDENYDKLIRLYTKDGDKRQFLAFMQTINGTAANSINQHIKKAVDNADESAINAIKSVLSVNQLVVQTPILGGKTKKYKYTYMKNKTRKRRAHKRKHHKGGFTYKSNSKRKSISNSRKSMSKTPRSSSSSTHSSSH
jgi:chromosome segregation ATPase